MIGLLFLALALLLIAIVLLAIELYYFRHTEDDEQLSELEVREHLRPASSVHVLGRDEDDAA